MPAPFDTLKLARQFEAAGFETKQAGDMAAALADAMSGANLATKQDLELLRAALEARIDRIVVRLGSLIVVIAGLLFAALHYWPPH